MECIRFPRASLCLCAEQHNWNMAHEIRKGESHIRNDQAKWPGRRLFRNEATASGYTPNVKWEKVLSDGRESAGRIRPLF